FLRDADVSDEPLGIPAGQGAVQRVHRHRADGDYTGAWRNAIADSPARGLAAVADCDGRLGYGGMVFFLFSFFVVDPAHRYFQQRDVSFLFRVSLCQLDVLPTRPLAAVVSRDWTRKSNHLAGGFAAVYVNRAGESAPVGIGSDSLRDFRGGVFRLRGSQPEA